MTFAVAVPLNIAKSGSARYARLIIMVEDLKGVDGV